MADESTDIKNIDTKGDTQAAFVQDEEIEDGKADTIMEVCKNYVESKLTMSKFVSFGSDGCSVMVGRNNGVAKKLKDIRSELINIHCHNHRLALPSKYSFESIDMYNPWDGDMTSLYYYYMTSPVRDYALQRIQNVLGKDTTKIKNSAHTR